MDHEHSILVPIKNIFFKKGRLLANFSQATSSKDIEKNEGNMVDLLKKAHFILQGKVLTWFWG